MTTDQILNQMVEVKLNSDDDFLKVLETLTRIGVANKTTKVLNQSCHILHKQGIYYIAHFKEMYKLDRKHADVSAADLGRRNYICKLLQDWGLLTIVSKQQSSWPMSGPSCVKIVKHSEKHEWTLKQKYAIGVMKNKYNKAS